MFLGVAIMGDSLISTIATFSDRYRQEHLDKYKPDQLLTDWWMALDFFLARVCFQGRRDTESEKVYRAAIEVLKQYFTSDDRDGKYEMLKTEGWLPLQKQLTACIGMGMVGKPRDIDMVLGTLEYIGKLPNKNITDHSVSEIKKGRLQQHYNQIQRAKSPGGIVQVGPKVASFYLRDVVSLYKLEESIADESAFCLQPIDVWVKKIAQKSGIAKPDSTHAEIRNAILAVCKQRGISPVLFNQGAWYVGYHAFDLLLDTLAEESNS
jgi:hypothetical protein